MEEGNTPNPNIGNNPEPSIGNSPEPSIGNSPEPKESKLAKLNPKNLWVWFMGKSRNFKLVSILVIILIVVGLVSLAIVSGNSDSDEFAQEEIPQEIEEIETIPANVSLVEGTVEVQIDNGEWEDISTDDEINQGSSIKTVGATSRAVIAFEDGSEFRLDANSEAKFITLTEDRIVVRHTDGYSYNRVVESSSREYIVESKDAEYESLGTAFKTSMTGDEQSVEVFQGEVHETVTNEKPEQGEKLIVKSFAQPEKNGTIEPLDIEQIKQDQFIQWNKELDQQNDLFKNSLGYLSDFDGPELNITSHSNGDTVLLDFGSDEATITFTGTTEKGTKLTVLAKSNPDAQPITITVGDDGAFTSPVISSPFGDSSFVFVATDRRGNKTEQVLRLNLQKKSQPVNAQAGGIIITDTAVNGNNVTVTWALTGSQETPDGVKVLYKLSSESGELLLGSHNTKLSSSDTKTSYEIKGLSSGTYDFRVCVYDKASGECGKFSPTEPSVIVP